MRDETIKILEILQTRPDLVLTALSIAVKQVQIYGIPVEADPQYVRPE